MMVDKFQQRDYVLFKGTVEHIGTQRIVKHLPVFFYFLLSIHSLLIAKIKTKQNRKIIHIRVP